MCVGRMTFCRLLVFLCMLGKEGINGRLREYVEDARGSDAHLCYIEGLSL